MSTLNDLVYKSASGKTDTNLDGLRSAFCQLMRKLEGKDSQISFERVENSFLFHTGFDLAFLNQANVFDKSPDVLEAMLVKVASWNIKCCVALAGPGLVHAEKLRQRGFTSGGATPFMAYAVDDRLNDFQLRTGLRAERTTASHNFDLNVDLVAGTFGMERETVVALMSATISDPETFRYILFDGEQAVSTSVFLAEGDLAGCFDVATPADHQRKGYGEELMKFMIKEQAHLGRKLIALQSSEAGEALYRRMGYQVIEYFQMWIMDRPVRLNRLEMLDINIGKYRLRQLTLDDEALILEKFEDEAFQKWMGMPIPFLKQNFLNFLTSCQNQYLSGNGVWWVIEEDGVPMGQVWLFNQDWYEKKTEIGYLAYPEARGKGMIPFITRELTKKLLFEYKMERVELTTHYKNDTSGHVAKKAGFVFEAQQRRKKIYRGEVIDFNLYSMIASDFDATEQGDLK